MKKSFAIGGIFVVAAFVVGLYNLSRVQSLANAEALAKEELSAGNYLASLFHFSDVKKNSVDESVAEENIDEVKDLLVAEEIFERAQTASQSGDWFETKTLLQKSDATLNSSFKYYEEALELYIEAAEKVKDLEAKIEGELAALRQEALEEKTQRAQIEKKKAQVEQKLEITIVEGERREEELQTRIIESEALRVEAEHKAVQEALEKFLNELSLYVAMLVKGSGYLDDALLEIDIGRDIAAFVLINQGKVLFDEVRVRGEELLANRTPDEYKEYVNKLLQASALLIDASRAFANAVFYIDQKDSDEFAKFLNNGKERQKTALQLIAEIQNLINSLQQ